MLIVSTQEEQMKFELNEIERKLLISLNKGINKVEIYKCGLYPTVVTFVLAEGNKVTLRARGEEIAPRFEVFPISVSDEEINDEPEKIINGSYFEEISHISILQKSEWSVLSTDKEKQEMVGNTTNATTQYEGKESEIPNNAINHVTLHSGIEIVTKNNKSFLVSTSMFPFAFYVSNCEFSELVDPAIYEHIKLC